MHFSSLRGIIHQYIHDGQSVALEGFTHLILFAVGHEILRQKKRDLHLIRMTPLPVAYTIDVVAPSTSEELPVLRDLHKRTEIAHAGDAHRIRKTPRPWLEQARSIA